jgi:hypothetical protein
VKSHILSHSISKERSNDLPETIQQITSACGILAPIEYNHRHNSVTKIIHQELGKNMGFVQMLFRITNINHQWFWIIKLSLCTGTEQYTPLEPYQTTDPISRLLSSEVCYHQYNKYCSGLSESQRIRLKTNSFTWSQRPVNLIM